jgi:sec-independent protein translocase protein TatA
VVNCYGDNLDASDAPKSGRLIWAPAGETMFGFGVAELVLVLAVVLFVFGWGRLPQLGGNVRQAIRNFKQTAQGGDEMDVTPTTPEETERKESRHVR